MLAVWNTRGARNLTDQTISNARPFNAMGAINFPLTCPILKFRFVLEAQKSPLAEFLTLVCFIALSTPLRTNEDDLREYFSTFGPLADVYIPRPHRGFAFITFEKGDDAEVVLKVKLLPFSFSNKLEDKIGSSFFNTRVIRNDLCKFFTFFSKNTS